MKRIIFALVAGWLFCAPLHAAEKIRVSVTNYNLSYLAAGVAAQRGFFKEEGLDVEINRLVIDDAQKALKATRTFAISEVADAGPLREAQRSLGIKAK